MQPAELVVFKHLRSRARAGHVQSQYELGHAYHWGRIPGSKIRLDERDQEQARHWLTLAAQANHPVAQYRLGLLLLRDQTAPEQAPEGREWLRQSARHGHAQAMLHLADYTYYGWHGFEPDLAVAAGWYEAAAQQENAEAQFMCGLLCLFGQGRPRDLVAALTWLEAASQSNLAAASLLAGDIHKYGLGVPADEFLAQEHYRRVKRLPFAGMNPYPLSNFGNPVVELFDKPPSGLPNLHLSTLWHYRMATDGSLYSRAELVRRYLLGRGVPRDPFKAYLWAVLAERQVSETKTYASGEWLDELVDEVASLRDVAYESLDFEDRRRADAVKDLCEVMDAVISFPEF